MQTEFQLGGYPVAYILYADKTRLSSFGSKKGYPIVARLANLSAEIRNGDGYGGGQVVGFLPIVCALQIKFTVVELYSLCFCRLRMRRKRAN